MHAMPVTVLPPYSHHPAMHYGACRYVYQQRPNSHTVSFAVAALLDAGTIELSVWWPHTSHIETSQEEPPLYVRVDRVWADDCAPELTRDEVEAWMARHDTLAGLLLGDILAAAERAHDEMAERRFDAHT